MKRDFELIKEILLQVENHKDPNKWVKLDIKNETHENVAHHVKLLAQAGLLDAIDASSSDGIDWIPKSLTWEGHDFLENARNDTVWKKTLQLVKDKGGSISFSIFQNLLQTQAMRLFE